MVYDLALVTETCAQQQNHGKMNKKGFQAKLKTFMEQELAICCCRADRVRFGNVIFIIWAAAVMNNVEI